jgi:uncharacterized protein YfaS (alpha-2-macroglobulin family)
LVVLATVAPDDPRTGSLVERLGSHSRDGRWGNTQENGFALTAMGMLAAAMDLSPATGEVLVDGELAGVFDGDGIVLHGRDWAGKTVTLRATGGGAAYWSVLDEGIPQQGGERDVDAGLLVERTYLDEYGRPVDPDAVVRGSVIVCRLSLESRKGAVDDVVISDLLPAGLEIERSRLTTAGSWQWLESRLHRENLLRVDHVEARDDRLLLFVQAEGERKEYYYSLRAVTPGLFILPPVRAEAMYDASVYSVREPGRLIIEAP